MISLPVLLNTPQVHLCHCYEILRKDGLVQLFTDLDVPVTIGTKTFTPAVDISNSALEVSSGFKENSRELTGIISSDFISDEDIIAGMYDDAPIWEYIYDFENEEVIKRNAYWVRNKTYTGSTWQLDIIALSSWLTETQDAVISRTCEFELYSENECRVASSLYKQDRVIDSVTSQVEIVLQGTAEADNYFAYGYVENPYEKVDVHSNTGNTIRLVQPPKVSFSPGDTIKIYPGCDGSFTTCRNKFNNSINFGGAPHIIGNDAMLKNYAE